MKVAGKSVVITGAAQGIGRALSLQLAEKGAKIFAVDIDNEGLLELEDVFSKFGLTVKKLCGSVTDSSFLQRVRETVIAEHRQLDVWINNAGVALIKPFLDTSSEEFQRVLDINLSAVVNGTRIALEGMEQQGTGLIINVGSVAGYLPAALMSSYNASKFAITGFTKSLQAELQLNSSPVKMMLVSPGFVDTRIISRGKENGFPEWLSFMLSEPKDVARDIVRGILRGKTEINPTFNGKLMRRMYSVFPDTTVKSSRILLSNSLKDFLSNKTRPS